MKQMIEDLEDLASVLERRREEMLEEMTPEQRADYLLTYGGPKSLARRQRASGFVAAIVTVVSMCVVIAATNMYTHDSIRGQCDARGVASIDGEWYVCELQTERTGR